MIGERKWLTSFIEQEGGDVHFVGNEKEKIIGHSNIRINQKTL